MPDFYDAPIAATASTTQILLKPELGGAANFVNAMPAWPPFGNELYEFTVSGINLAVSAITSIYTVQTGQSFCLYNWGLSIASATVTGAATSSTLQVTVGGLPGSTSGYSDLASQTPTVSGFSVNSLVWYPFASGTVITSLTAGQTLSFNCHGFGASANTLNGNVHFIGVLKQGY